MASTIIILIIIAIALFILPIWLGRWRMTRAAKQVINAFIQLGAIGPNNARTQQELGIIKRSFALVRDYRVTALQELIRADAVRQTEEGKLYLSQETYERYIALYGGRTR